VSTYLSPERREAARALARAPRARFLPEFPVDGFEVWRLEHAGEILGYCAVAPDKRRTEFDPVGRAHLGSGHTRAGFGVSPIAAARDLVERLDPVGEPRLEALTI
jgi:hypothetical protein